MTARLAQAKTTTSDCLYIALLVAIQIVVTLLVSPRGNFGVNDDWTYAQSVLWLIGEHRVRLSAWATPNLLPQILMGGLATAIFGFSFEVLRHLTQIVAIGQTLLPTVPPRPTPHTVMPTVSATAPLAPILPLPRAPLATLRAIIPPIPTSPVKIPL